MSLLSGLLLAALSGGLIALMGVAYRWGENRQITSMQILAMASLVGAACYAWFGAAEFARAPGWLWWSAIGVGVSQYLLIRAINFTLRLGPLSPLWCALMLNFIPIILYADAFLGEALDGWQLLAVAASVLAVLAAAAGGRKTAGGRSRFSWCYAVMLLALLLLNSVINLVMKLLAMTPSGVVPEVAWLGYCGNFFLFLVYASSCLLMTADLCVTRSWRGGALVWGTAGLAAFGSIAGMGLQKWVIGFPAALVFSVSCSASILTAALFSSCCFGEERRWNWYATLLLALAAIVLANRNALF